MTKEYYDMRITDLTNRIALQDTKIKLAEKCGRLIEAKQQTDILNRLEQERLEYIEKLEACDGNN